jgi:F-box/leucine-rich repeat protein 2/20
VVDLDLPGSPSVGQGSCFLPGCGDLRSIDRDFSPDALYEVPVARPSDAAILKGKGRSYSSPFPLASSPLDIISAPELNPLSPTRVEVRDFFDEMLPRELKLHIFASLMSAHEADFHRMSLGTHWSALKASSTKNKWVGRDKGLRELIKLGRVSESL